jgi:hypothetical protein
MRLSQELRRFDVKIPEHRRLISPLDLANWVDAGFVLKK